MIRIKEIRITRLEDERWRLILEREYDNNYEMTYDTLKECLGLLPHHLIKNGEGYFDLILGD